MTYSTGDITSITINDFKIDPWELDDHAEEPIHGDLVLNITLDDGTKYRGSVRISADDYRHDLIEDLNYDIGRKKIDKMENMRDLLLTANYDNEDIEKFGNHVNRDEYSAPF